MNEKGLRDQKKRTKRPRKRGPKFRNSATGRSKLELSEPTAVGSKRNRGIIHPSKKSRSLKKKGTANPLVCSNELKKKARAFREGVKEAMQEQFSIF